MTLAELAKRAGCSAGLLSQVELGRVTPSIPTLVSVARELGVTAGSLFPTTDEAVAKFRPKENAIREVIGPSGLVLETVATIPVGFGDDILVWLTDIPAGRGGGGSPIGDAREVAYCLSGKVRFEIEGVEHFLSRGDSITYRCGHAHYWNNVGRGPAQVIWVIVPGICYHGSNGFYASGKTKEDSEGNWRKVVGDRIHAFRRQRHTTLSMIAKRVGCSVGLLSQIEHGRAAPSVPMLCRIAEALDVPAGALFPPVQSDQVILSRAVDRAESEEDSPGLLLLPIARIDLGFEESVLVYHAVFGPQSVPVTDMMSHHGEEIIRSLKGGIKVEVGNQAYSLGEGDAVRLPASTHHRAVRLGRGAVEAIWIISPPVPRE